jgi:hypothetical protein
MSNCQSQTDTKLVRKYVDSVLISHDIMNRVEHFGCFESYNLREKAASHKLFLFQEYHLIKYLLLFWWDA